MNSEDMKEIRPANININTMNLDIELETHIFTCIKYKDSPDNGFSANLYMLLEAIEHCEGVKDQGVKLIAKGLLKSVMQHKIHKIDMVEYNKNYEIWKENEKEKENKI